MVDWLAANFRDRAAYDAICEADRATSAEICRACGEVECGSAFCDPKRRKAEQQAKAQAWAARAGVTGDAR